MLLGCYNNECSTYECDASVSVSIRTSTLPSCLTKPRPSVPNLLANDCPAAEEPTIDTLRILPSAGWLLNLVTAALAAPAVLKWIRTRTFCPPSTSFWSVTAPHRLKMAATSSAVVPGAKPFTSTTFPWDAPLIESWSDLWTPVASLRAFWAMVLREALGGTGPPEIRADRELCCSNRS